MPNGKAPVNIFMDDQSEKMIAKILTRIDLLEKNGPKLGEPYSKFIDDGIYELRCQTEGNNARILYFFVSGRKVILTNGFMKKTEKTPLDEIAKAKRYRTDFMKTIKKGQGNDT